MKRIVLGYDASPAAERALERTVGLATALGARVFAASILLIAVGMSSRDLVSRLHGGVSDDVAHAAHCDVLLVH